MANPGSELCKPVRPAHTPLAWPIKHNQNLRNLAFTYEPRLGGYSRGTNITAQPLKVPKVIRERPLSSRFQKSRVSYNWYPCCCHYQPLPPSPALYIMSTFRISRRSESTQENATNDINRVLPSETEPPNSGVHLEALQHGSEEPNSGHGEPCDDAQKRTIPGAFEEELPQSDAENVTTVRQTSTPEEKPDIDINASEGQRDSTQSWGVVLDGMTQYDEKLVGDWKDDLNNLLVFTGLFSGVVTAFTLESYSWLQKDPADTTVQLLGQISLQLSSLTITPGFINSTVPNLQAQVVDAFAPSPLAVRVNTLWILSLAISLITALFAIMIQQWIRQYRLPQHTSIRERVRLRQFRFQGLVLWRVPDMVSSLPILLQIALVLFLSGLFYLTLSLNIVVATTLGAFLFPAFLLIIATVMMPLMFKSCPYKSPLAHAIQYCLNRSLVLVSLLISIAVMIAVICVGIAVGFCSAFVNTPRNMDAANWFTTISKRIFRILAKVSTVYFDAHVELAGSQYWTARELDALPKTARLDEAALTWAPASLSSAELHHLHQCLPDLSPEERTRCVMGWMARTLNIQLTFLDDAATEVFSPFGQTTLAKIDKTFAERYRDILLLALPQDLRSEDSITKYYFGPTFFIILRQIMKVSPDCDYSIRVRYTKRLMELRGSQTPESLSDIWTWTRIPTVSLFECGTLLGYKFDDAETDKLLGWASEAFSALSSTSTSVSFYWIDKAELLLSSSATALFAVNQQPSRIQNPELRAKCRDILISLNELISIEQGRIRSLALMSQEWSSDGVQYITVSAFVSICQSLVAFAEVGCLPLDERCPSQLLTSNLSRLFEGQASLEGALPHLERVRTICWPDAVPASNPSGSSPVDDSGQNQIVDSSPGSGNGDGDSDKKSLHGQDVVILPEVLREDIPILRT